MTICAVTGHRPGRLGDGAAARGRGQYTWYKRSLLMKKLYEFAKVELLTIAPEQVMTGMALGWDMVIAAACYELKIPYIACIPCDNQESKWQPSDREHYYDLLQKAYEVVNVSPGPYAVTKMFRRNEYMVDRCDVLLALWDGDYQGGTGGCVRYAEHLALRTGKPRIIQCWERWAQLL